MFDEELIYDLKTLKKTYKDKLFSNIETTKKEKAQYVVTIALLDSLIYCIVEDKLDVFETILQYNVKRFGNYT